MPKALTKHAAARPLVSASMPTAMGINTATSGYGDVEAAEQRLKHQPFRGEAVERRQRRDRDRANQEEERRPRHPLDQPAHLLHVARVRRVQHRARAEEQQPLKQAWLMV